MRTAAPTKGSDVLDVVDVLKQLVAIPSVNPMGRDLEGPEFLEYRVTEYLEKLFAELDVPSQRQTVAPLRDNIIARLDSDGPIERSPLIVFEAHQDTVPVDDMTISPWTPEVRDGRMYGRGSCDVKGGLAAMLAAFSRLVTERPRGRPTVLLAATVNEEFGFSGAKALCGLWRSEAEQLLSRKPDAIIVAEPTRLSTVVAHKGAVRWRAHVRGRAAHSSQPELGENAIYKMARLVSALETCARDVVPGLGQHRLCGRPSLSVGTIHGGISVNTVPDRATIEIDRRVMPGEDPTAAYGHVLDYLHSQCLGFEIEHESPYLETAGLSDDMNESLASAMARSVHAVTGRAETIGVPFGTNAATYAAAGVPSVVFGPGDIAQAHTADEWISLDQLKAASEIYYRFARDTTAMLS